MSRALRGRYGLGALCAVAALLLASPAGTAPTAKQAADAIIELDVERGKSLLEGTAARQDLAFERARLALYLGDCETAQAILNSPQFSDLEEARHFQDVATGCTGTAAGGLVIEDAEHGVWIRLQDEEDRALVPRMVKVAAQARARIEQDLGVVMPRPLRIDLVRDLFSLAAVTGLPLQAAETTGTVAVARWGRVTMLSPRAASMGYPWEDTLAHEITHLALSRATRDRAPLWLQEGVAKREETRWRDPQPFDTTDHHQVSRAAQAEGKSVGINGLGSSIAMLPTPEAASIAFAEVASFISFWLEQNGAPALQLLLRDLKGVGERGTEGALLSVTGVSLSEWNARWQSWLELSVAAPKPAPAPSPLEQRKRQQRREDALRYARLGDLLFDRGHAPAAEHKLLRVFEVGPDDPMTRARLGRAALAQGNAERAQEWVGKLDDVSSASAHYWALRARFGLGTGKQPEGSLEAHTAAYELGVSVDPLSELVACGGYWKAKAAPAQDPASGARQPAVSPGNAPQQNPPPNSHAPSSTLGGSGPGVGKANTGDPTRDPERLSVAYQELCEAARRFARD